MQQYAASVDIFQVVFHPDEPVEARCFLMPAMCNSKAPCGCLHSTRYQGTDSIMMLQASFPSPHQIWTCGHPPPSPRRKHGKGKAWTFPFATELHEGYDPNQLQDLQSQALPPAGKANFKGKAFSTVSESLEPL